VAPSSASPQHDRLAYMPALDGVRAMAVAAVLLYHGDVSWARGGYLGVDAFFVLSGFLITSLLLAEWRGDGRIALSAFWARRARRLLPALFLVLAAVAAYGALIAAPAELAHLRRDGLSALGYVANWGQIFSHQSYFESFAAPCFHPGGDHRHKAAQYTLDLQLEFVRKVSGCDGQRDGVYLLDYVGHVSALPPGDRPGLSV